MTIFNYEKNHLLKILSSLIVKFSDVQAENFYFQVNFTNCYLGEINSFTKKNDIRDWGQSKNKEIPAVWIQIRPDLFLISHPNYMLLVFKRSTQNTVLD